MTWKASMKRTIRQTKQARYDQRPRWTPRGVKAQHDPCMKSSKGASSDNSIPREFKQAHVSARAALGKDFPCYDNYPDINYQRIAAAGIAKVFRTPDHTSPAIRPQGMTDEDWSEHLNNTIYKHKEMEA